jgi:hypothetical protein
MDSWGAVEDVTQNVNYKSGLTLDQASASFSFERQDGTFTVEDLVKVWIKKDSSTFTTDDLAIAGYVTSVKSSVNSTQKVVTVEGMPRIRQLFDRKVPAFVFDGNAGTPSGFTNYNSTDAIRYLCSLYAQDIKTDTYLAVTPRKIEPEDSGGQGAYTSYGKSLYQMITELCADQYTGDGNYVVWVDNNNYLHFQPKGDGSFDTTLEEYENVVAWDVEKHIFGYTVVFINAGTDTSGNVVLEYAVNAKAAALWGYKEEYKSMPNIMEDIKKAYPGYNDAQLRAEGHKQARAIAESLVRAGGEPRYEGKITIRGTLDYNLNNKVVFISETMDDLFPNEDWNTTGQSFIVKGIQQSLSTTGWKTELTIEEDIEEGGGLH